MKKIKPYLKGTLMVIIGTINTIRLEIGIGRIWINIIFGPLTYIFLCFSGLIVKNLILIQNNSSNKNKLLILLGIIWGFGFGFMLFYVLIYNLNIFIIVITIIIGLIWFGLWLFTYYYNQREITVKLMENLCFTFGILYGAILDTSFIPIFVYFFFIIAFSSQLSRDLTRIRKIESDNHPKAKKSNNQSNTRKYKTNDLEQKFGNHKILKLSLIFQLISIILLIFSFFTDLYSPILYLYPSVIAIIFLLSSSILSIKGVIQDKNNKIISKIIKIALAFELIAFILANF
ncbi:MAG: hypothetical protein GF329_22395 [Candidatus Lokiarchaeota archaeon]|nr:hypothetical protein [Candidatus Lokiarchaeota archaeon]